MQIDTERNETRAGGLYTGLCATAFLSYCSYAMCRVPAIPLFASELGAGPATIGLVMGASTVTGIFLKLPAGAWSDVVGRRPLLILATIVYATLPFSYVGVAAIGWLILVRAVHGSASAIFGPVAAAALSDAAPSNRRGTWLSTYAFFQGAGQAAGPVLAGYLIASSGFAAAFITAGVLALASPILAARLPLQKGTARASSPRALRDAVREVCRHRLIMVTSATQAAQYVQHGALSAFLPLYAQASLGLPTAGLGWLFAVQIGTTLLVRPLVGALSDRVGRRPLIAAGLLVSSCGVLGVTWASTAWWLTSAVAAYAVGVAITTASSSAYITDLSHRARYGASHGLFGSIYDIGDAAGPLLGGVLAAVAGYVPMFRIVGVSGIVAAGLFLLLSRREKRTEHQSMDSANTSST
jgi:DHA1 family multidrug resistance protein-like MFS transporter